MHHFYILLYLNWDNISFNKNIESIVFIFLSFEESNYKLFKENLN